MRRDRQPPQQLGVSDHALLTNVTFAQHHAHVAHQYHPWYDPEPNSGFLVTTGRVTLMPIFTRYQMTVDALIVCFGPNVAGNARVGLYQDNGSTPAGGSLLRESVSTAITGTWRAQEIPFGAPEQLDPGRYWLAYQGDTGPTNMGGVPDVQTGGVAGQITVECKSYNQAYGAFTTPCPAVVFQADTVYMALRVASMP